MNAQVQTANFIIDWKEGDGINSSNIRLSKIKWAENINQFEGQHLKTTP